MTKLNLNNLDFESKTFFYLRVYARASGQKEENRDEKIGVMFH